MLPVLRRVGFDLGNPGNVVMKKRVHVAGSIPLSPVALPGVSGVDPRADHEKGHGEGCPERHCNVGVIHDRAYGQELDHGDEAQFDAVDQHAFHGGDVFDDASHDIARAAPIEPAERQALEFLVQIRADIKNHPLLEMVV